MSYVNDNSVYKDTIRLTTNLQNVTKTISISLTIEIYYAS